MKNQPGHTQYKRAGSHVKQTEEEEKEDVHQQRRSNRWTPGHQWPYSPAVSSSLMAMAVAVAVIDAVSTTTTTKQSSVCTPPQCKHWSSENPERGQRLRR
ncbi:unnamed protein product [Ceratitis capitata]|uniref:(Mediterranean fruit fly) hypothetical protein n=1 Tax=Ceratitis capitata TaxID=7213 RepID=A0A811U3Z9_CERCA|nr:unnamed protein product [Ceratitis capitata]